MGTIVKRSRKDGSVAWLAQIVIKRGGKIVLRENKTFELRSTANAWLSQREDRLGQPGALEAALKSRSRGNQEPTLSDAIDLYIRESNKKIGRTKAQVLRSIKDFDIADKTCASITSADIVALPNMPKLCCCWKPMPPATFSPSPVPLLLFRHWSPRSRNPELRATRHSD